MSFPTSLAIGLPETTRAFDPSMTRVLPGFQLLAMPPDGEVPGAVTRRAQPGATATMANSRPATYICTLSSVKELNGGAELPGASYFS
jgi:hypothetical protein